MRPKGKDRQSQGPAVGPRGQSRAAGQQRKDSRNQGIPGGNGYAYSYQGAKGYNMVVGNSTVIGRKFILAPQLPAAGIPQTPSNP
jgi:hypothetical protein